MQTENRPSAALINKEWWESARKVLSYDEQGILLIEAVEYVLYGTGRTTPGGKVKIVFEMIRPALDSDITKYRERCARNAINARSGRERVEANGTQSQRVGANTTPTPTPTPTPTTTQISLEEREMIEKREKWLIYGYFWASGSVAIAEECSAFWSYYESLGWKNNKGAVIVSKLAAARMWRRQFETRTPPNGADIWWKAAKECSVPDYRVWDCYTGSENIEGRMVLRLRADEDFKQYLLEKTPTLMRSLRAYLQYEDVILQLPG